MSDNRGNDNFVPFDTDDEVYRSEFDANYDQVHDEESLEDVRGESELSKQKKITKRGQKAIVFTLILFGSIVASAMVGYMMFFKDGESLETEEQSVASFQRPEKRDFGREYIEDDIGEYDPMSAIEDENNENGLIVEQQDLDTSGIAGVSSSEPNFTTIEPPPSPTYIDQTPSPTYTEQALPTPIPEPVEEPLTPQELRKQRIYSAGFSGLPGFGGSSDTASASTQGVKGRSSDSKEDALASKLSPAVLTASSAVKMNNRDMMLTKGNMIDCVLDTKFDSTVVSMLSCTVTRNIYSATGRVVLIDRGSKITGEYKGDMEQGNNRVFVLWNRIETPKGVMIDINSPGAGPLGEGGHSGRVDSKFWKRFGGAMLVSLVDDLGGALSERVANKTVGGGDTNIRFEESSKTASEVTKSILEETLNIKPSLIKHQGDRISIYVARDVYFGDVYDLKPKK